MFWAARILLFFFVFSVTCFSFLTAAEVQKVNITPDKGTTLTFSSSPSTGSGCQVCTGVLTKKKCDTSRTFNEGPVSVELECKKRQGPFHVEVSRTFECSTSCNYSIQTDSKYDALLDLNRTFVWNINATTRKAARINFGKNGLKQIRPSDSCPDHHLFTYEVQSSGKVLVGTYCNSGFIKDGQAVRASSFSLQLPAKQKLQNIVFNISFGDEILSLAKMSVSLPPHVSSLELFSPNYPASFPDDDVMEWYLVVPQKHKASIELLNVTEPRCVRKEPGVEYRRTARRALLAELTEPQPEQREGGFTMILRNCKMDRTRASSSGLATSFRVSASKANTLVLCDVDLRKESSSLHLKKLNRNCIIKQDSVSVDQTTLMPGTITKMSFQACVPKDILVTASEQMGCSRARSCSTFFLSIPGLPQCLPALLSNMMWDLRLPPNGTVEMGCASGTLRRELPGQPCNDSISIKMAEVNGSTIGTFCRQGSITKLYVHTNMTITVSGTSGSLAPTSSHILTAQVKDEISERYIFRVSPSKNNSLFLATPGWPKGMSSHSTVSWIVTVPSKMVAHVMFPDLKQPQCQEGHTKILIHRLGREEEDYSRREDESFEHEITVSESFYLNMTSCKPHHGDFSVLTKVTLKKSQLMTVVVAVVATLLVIFTGVLVAVCLVIRKKKKKLEHQVSVYNPAGTRFLPGQNGYPGSQEEDVYHVYEDIEDTLVYTHLLRKGEKMGIYGERNDQPQDGGSDSQAPLEVRESGAGDAEVGEYQEFSQQEKPELPQRPPNHTQSMVSNDLYEAGGGEGRRSPSLGPRLDPDGGEQ